MLVIGPFELETHVEIKPAENTELSDYPASALPVDVSSGRDSGPRTCGRSSNSGVPSNSGVDRPIQARSASKGNAAWPHASRAWASRISSSVSSQPMQPSVTDTPYSSRERSLLTGWLPG